MRLSIIGKFVDKSFIGNCKAFRIIDVDTLEVRDISYNSIIQAHNKYDISVKGLNYTKDKIYIASKSCIINIDKLQDPRNIKENVYIYLKDNGPYSIMSNCNGEITKIDRDTINEFIQNNIVIGLNYSGININTAILEHKNKIEHKEFDSAIAIGVNRQNNNINNKALYYKIYKIDTKETHMVDIETIKSALINKSNIFPLVYTQGSVKLDVHLCIGDYLPLVDSNGELINKQDENIYIPLSINNKHIKCMNYNSEIHYIPINKFMNFKIIGTMQGLSIDKLYNKLSFSNKKSINTYKQSLYDWCIEHGDYGKQLIDEYHDKENDIKVLSHSSHKSISWKCKYGHTYKLSPARRTSKYMRGCTECSKLRGGTSISELIYLYSIRQLFDEVIHRVKIDNLEFDIYIPSINTAIEYNSDYWHIEKEDNDNRKLSIANKNNIRLIRIWANRGADNIKITGNDIITKPEQSIRDYNEVIKILCSMINKELTDINIEKSYNMAFNNANNSNLNSNKSMSTLYKNTVQQLFIDKTDAEHITPGSNKEIKLLCPICNNTWTTTPNLLTRGNVRGHNDRKDDNNIKCRYCKNTVLDMIKLYNNKYNRI